MTRLKRLEFFAGQGGQVAILVGFDQLPIASDFDPEFLELSVGGDDRFELPVFPIELSKAVLVVHDLGVGQKRVQLIQTLFGAIKTVEHADRL